MYLCIYLVENLPKMIKRLIYQISGFKTKIFRKIKKRFLSYKIVLSPFLFTHAFYFLSKIFILHMY